jgi:NTE family protein
MIGWRKDKVAFALSGGGARGAAQVGMLKALLEHGIKPDMVIGVSVVAWHGAWLARRPQLEWIERLEEVWRHVTRSALEMVWWRAARNVVRRRPSLYEGSGLSRLIASNMEEVRDIEDLAIPFHSVAIDLTEGRKVVFSSGPIAPAVLASSAIPGIFPAVEINGHQHVDGGMVDPSGLATAIELGAKRIYLLDCGYAGTLPGPLSSMNSIIDHTFQVAAQHLTDRIIREHREAEIIHLRPGAGFLKHSMDFKPTGEYLEEGYRYTVEALAGLRSKRRSISSGSGLPPDNSPGKAAYVVG